MNIENELKLIPSKGIRREQIVEVLRKKEIDVPEKGKVGHQEDTYFDDKQGTLEKAGGSFRIRRKNDKTQITYKIPIKSNTEYKQRKEYEIVVPKEYEQILDMDLAINLLKAQYPELKFPENMGEILTVINDRNKTNITCEDGTVIEMAFDTLQVRDGEGNLYQMPSEFELETISGDPENLTKVYEALLKGLPGQVKKNPLSKYARAKKEIQERKITLSEVAACALFSQILNSEEFAKLEFKGQVLHKHNKPTLTNLDSFKDFNYLVETIQKIKSGEYRVQIPRVIAEKPEMASLLAGQTYDIKDTINLKDMMCLLLSDVKYPVAAEVLVDFLNTNFYGQENAITNRMNHSQQVMLYSGLIAKSSYVDATFEDRLSSMITALSHDIGHVPTAHNLEGVLKKIDGIFSHEVNGKITLDNIYERKEEDLLSYMQSYFPEILPQKIKTALVNKATEIKSGIMNHSRKGAEHREQGIVKQAARLADKMYAISDIRDFEQQMGISVMDDNWEKEAFLAICKSNEELADEVKERLDKVFLQSIKEGDYGRAAVNIINTVHRHESADIYSADQDAWNLIDQLIKRVKSVREACGVEDDKSAMTDAAKILIDKWLCEEYEKAGGDIDLAWKKLLGRVTNTGELDVLANLKEIKKSQEDIQKGNGNDLEKNKPLAPEEMDKDEILDYMKEKLFSASKSKFKKDGMPKVEIEGYAQEEVEKMINSLENLTVKELLQLDRYFVPSISEGVLAKRLENKVRGIADVQIKMKPDRRDFLDKICNILGVTLGNPDRKLFKDEYYNCKCNGVSEPAARVRLRTETEGEDKKKSLTVKKPVGKKVSERIDKNYTVTQKEPEDLDLTIEGWMQKLKEKYTGLDIELQGNEPIEKLGITRHLHQVTYKGYNVIIVEDEFGKEDDNIVYKEIEIKCPENPSIVTQIKKLLKGKGIEFITKSKIERISNQANKGATDRGLVLGE